MTCKYESVQTGPFIHHASSSLAYRPQLQGAIRGSSIPSCTSSAKTAIFTSALLTRPRCFCQIFTVIIFNRIVKLFSSFLFSLLFCCVQFPLLSFFFPGFCILVSGIILSFLDPTFAPYMKKVSSGSRKENRNKGKSQRNEREIRRLDSFIPL